MPSFVLLLLFPQAILKLGGTGPKSASRLNFPLGDYSAADLEQLALPGTAGSSKVQQQQQQRSRGGRAGKRKSGAAAAAAAGSDGDSGEGQARRQQMLLWMLMHEDHSLEI